MSRVSGYLTTADGSTAGLDAGRARRLLRDGTLFWLDLDRPTDSELGLPMVSQRLNTVMKQLTMIATIFLPLSFRRRGLL